MDKIVFEIWNRFCGFMDNILRRRGLYVYSCLVLYVG